MKSKYEQAVKLGLGVAERETWPAIEEMNADLGTIFSTQSMAFPLGSFPDGFSQRGGGSRIPIA